MGEMPRDLSEEAVAEWLLATSLPPGKEYADMEGARRGALLVARAVLALVRAKVREGVRETIRVLDEIDLCDEDERTIVARVMNKEAPRV